jgi:hypothetical protein
VIYMNVELRTKKLEPRKAARRPLAEGDTTAVEAGIPTCNLGTRGAGKAGPRSGSSRKPKAAAREPAAVLRADDPSLEQQPGELAMAHRARTRRAYAARLEREIERRADEPKGRPNPLLLLPDERRAKLFFWLRECPYPDAVRQMLAEQELPGVTDGELNEFFKTDAQLHWERRLQQPRALALRDHRRCAGDGAF